MTRGGNSGKWGKGPACRDAFVQAAHATLFPLLRRDLVEPTGSGYRYRVGLTRRWSAGANPYRTVNPSSISIQLFFNSQSSRLGSTVVTCTETGKGNATPHVSWKERG